MPGRITPGSDPAGISPEPGKGRSRLGARLRAASSQPCPLADCQHQADPSGADSWEIPKGGDPAGIPLERRRAGSGRGRLQEIAVLWLCGSAEQIPLQADPKQIPLESGWDSTGIPLSSAEADRVAPGQQCRLPTHRHKADPFPGRSRADPRDQSRDPTGILPPPPSSAVQGPRQGCPPTAAPMGGLNGSLSGYLLSGFPKAGI